MDVIMIEQAFEKMINKRGIYKVLGIEQTYVGVLRHKLKNDGSISLEKKIELLEKSGWKPPTLVYSEADLVSALKFGASHATQLKTLGVGYVVDKWKAIKNNNS